ncbi:MAG: accessory factor UbiK family protein [Alphaproteobacteria bacterium]
MQSKSKPLDDITNLVTNAVGAVKGVGDEMKAMGRAQAERLISDMDLVSRDEFEILKEMFLTAKAENEALAKKVASLDRQVKALKKA